MGDPPEPLGMGVVDENNWSNVLGVGWGSERGYVEIYLKKMGEVGKLSLEDGRSR